MILSLVLGWIALYASRTCLYPLFPVIAADLGISSAQAGSLSGFYFMLYVALQIPAGLLMDRLGTKRCLTAGYILSGAALIAIGFWGNSYGALLFFFGVQGFGDSFYYSGAQGTIVTHTPPERKVLYSALLGIGMALGVLIGLGSSHFLYVTLKGYRMPFLFIGFLRLFVTIILACLLPDVRSGSAKMALSDYIPLFRDVTVWKISGAVFSLMYGFWVMVNWGPTFLRTELNFVAEQAGFYSGLVALASIPGGIFWGQLSKSIGGKLVIIITLALNGLFLISIAGVGPSYFLIVLSLLAFGFCSNSAVVPVAVVWVSHIASSRYQDKTVGAIAFFNCIIVSSAIVAPILSGFIRDVSGSLSGAIYLAAAAALVSPLLLKGIKTNVSD